MGSGDPCLVRSVGMLSSDGIYVIDMEIPFRFKTVAEEAVPSPSVVSLLCEETPVNRHSSGITQDRLDHAPCQQEEQDVEYD